MDNTRRRTFSDELFSLLETHVPPGSSVLTLGSGKPNRIVSLDRESMEVETQRSKAARKDPQPVPAWMFEVAWQRLRTRGRLTNSELLSTNDLNVKRSSLVCAVLAQLPGVRQRSSRPIVLSYDAEGAGS